MKNEYRITKSLLMSWAKEFHYFGINVFVAVLCWCLLADGVILAVTYAIDGDLLNKYFFLSVLFIAVSVYKLFFQRKVVMARSYKEYQKLYGVSEWTRTVEFLESDILLSDRDGETEYSTARVKYSNVKRIKEKGNVVFLYYGNRSAIHLYKDAFVGCTWDECKAMLEEKTTK